MREGSDEEHSTWSGGKEIVDLLQCGWGEKKMKKEKRENMIKMKIIKYEDIVKYDKIKILKNHEN